MTGVKSDFLSIIQERGFLHQATDLEALDALLVSGGPRTAYIGYDPTASSLHAGHLVSIMMLRWWQKCGNRPIALMGGATARIGDPTGKSETRKALSAEDVAANIEGIKGCFSRYLDFGGGPTSAQMVNNQDWLDALTYTGFLADYGRHFSVNRMLSFDSVKTRLEREQPLSFLEFNYMIFQSYDFLELYRREGCVLQMGGSDQWGNIVAGVELGRRLAGGALFGLTAPLLTTASGAKMGKTEAGAVWLNPDLLPPYDYWQYWRNCEDADLGKLLRLFTELPMDEIARLEALGGSEINEAKKVLADSMTAMLHGEQAAADARATAKSVFEGGGVGDALPEASVDSASLAKGVPLPDLYLALGFVKSKGEARRLIQGGGARVNDVAVDSEDRLVGTGDLTPDGVIKLSAGKKRHGLIRPQG
jgi:tyrosyl-tRNA synthetase